MAVRSLRKRKHPQQKVRKQKGICSASRHCCSSRQKSILFLLFLMQTITSGEAICGKVPVFFVVLELVEGQELGEYIAAIHKSVRQK